MKTIDPGAKKKNTSEVASTKHSSKVKDCGLVKEKKHLWVNKCLFIFKLSFALLSLTFD